MREANAPQLPTAPQAPTRARCDFRFSATDAVVLVVGIAATIALWQYASEMSLLVPLVLVHFFLFCNVFRVARRYELVWAAVFVVNLLAWQAAGRFTWTGILLVQTPVTLGVIALEMRSGRYHGVGWRRINPDCVHYRPGVTP